MQVRTLLMLGGLVLGGVGLGTATGSPLRAQEAGRTPAATGATSGDMASGTGGARPNAPAQGGVASRPDASAGQSSTPGGGNSRDNAPSAPQAAPAR